MNYLVTGAAGFIGSALARKLITQGHNVWIIDNLSTGIRENIPQEAFFIEGDCQDPSVIDNLDNVKFEAIFHIAGQSSGEISFDDPVYDLQTNTQSTLLLLKYALKVGCKKFIYASTMSVYGDQDILPVNEESPTFPKSFYGVGKLASEHYLRIYSEFNINCTALRLFNVYGPGQNMENLRQGMVSIFLAQALKNNHIHVKGDKNRFRDFVFIDDVINSFLLAEKSKLNGYNCWNVSAGEKTTIDFLLKTMIQEIGNEVTVEFDGKTLGDQFGIFGNNDLIKNKIGWTPRCRLTEGLKLMINWAKGN